MPLAAIVMATARAPWSDDAMALLSWSGDQTLIEFQIAQLQAAGVRDIEVVLGDDAAHVISLVAADNVEPIINKRWAEAPASSLRTGATAVARGTTEAVVIDIAEPREASVIEALLDAHRMYGAHITLAQVAGKRRTPVILGEHALAALRNVHGAQDLWSIVDRFAARAQGVHVEAVTSVFPSIESTETYERAREALRDR